MKPKTIVLALLAAALGATCWSQGTEPTADEPQESDLESALRQALDEYFLTAEACIELDIGFPAEFGTSRDSTLPRQLRFLDELVAAGLLEARESRKRIHRVPLDGPRVAEDVPARIYSLTRLGESVSSSWVTALGSTGTRLCYGSYRVVEIKNLEDSVRVIRVQSGSVEAMSQRTVHYTYVAEGIADWARGSVALQEDFPTLARDLGSETAPAAAKADLVHTPEGWVHRALWAPVWGSNLQPAGNPAVEELGL